MKNVSVKEVSVMQILEADEKKEKQLGMVLGVKKPNKGKLWYLGKGMKHVDIIDVVFDNNAGSDNEPGKLTVWISLLAGAYYEAPYVTAESEIEYIEFSPEAADSILKLTFIEPGENEHHYYPHLTFHTSEGLIDPAVSVRRGVGQ